MRYGERDLFLKYCDSIPALIGSGRKNRNILAVKEIAKRL